MRLFFLPTAVFLIVVTTSQGQNTNCNIDPDLISFEDKDLEAVIKSLYGSGNCSGVVWKEGVINVLKKHKKEILDMSVQDKSLLRYLISFVIKPEAERPPPDYFLYLGTLSESELMNPLDFGPSSESPVQSQDDYISPIYWKFGSDSKTDGTTSATRSKRQLQRFPEFTQPSRLDIPRVQRPESFPFSNKLEKPPNFKANVPSLFFFNKRSNHHSSNSKNVFEDEMQQNHWDSFNYEGHENFPQQRQPNQNLNDDFITPFTQQKPATEVWTNSEVEPFEYENSYNRPRPQGRPGGIFSRPPNKASASSFTPDKQRRPTNANGFSRPQRPQSEDTDIFMPDDQRLTAIVDDENIVFGNTNQVTTERPPRTTTPSGPPPWATPPSLCVRNCPNTPEFNPVCGSDRVTYSNPGRLRCEQQCGKARVALNYYGTCVTTTTDYSFSSFIPQTTPSPSLSRRFRNRNI